MGLPIHVLLGAVLFVWTVWAVLFWGGIAIVERHNPYNKFKWALVWSAVELIIAVSIGSLGMGGLGLLLAWFVFLVRLLLGHYELGLLHAIGVVIMTVAGPYLVADAFVAFVGTSETLFLGALYGLPAVVLGIWLWPRPAPAPPSNLPAARVERLGRRGRAEASAQAAPLVAAPPAPVAAPAPVLVAAPPPVAPPATAVAPPERPADPPRADGEPSFLR